MERHFTDELLAASTLAETGRILDDAAEAQAVAILIEELASRASSEVRQQVRLHCRELVWLLRDVERTSVDDALRARADVVRALREIVRARTWTDRDRVLAQHPSLREQSPSTAVVWFFPRAESTAQRWYLWRLVSCLRRIEAEPPRGFVDVHSGEERLQLLVEDLCGTDAAEEQFEVLRRYAGALQPAPTADALKKAFRDSYRGWTVKPPERAYLRLLIRWTAALGVDAAHEAYARRAEHVVAFINGGDDERIALLEQAPEVASRDSVALIDYWLMLDRTLQWEEADRIEHARLVLQIAVHRPPAEAIRLAWRKRKLAARMVMELVKANTAKKQIAILRRYEDLLRSTFALQMLEAIATDFADGRPLSPGARASFDRTRILLQETIADDVYAAIHLVEQFDSFFDILTHDRDAMVQAIEADRRAFDSTTERALTLLGAIAVRTIPNYSPALLLFGSVVANHFADDEELVSVAQCAVELARSGEHLSPVQRTFSDQVRGLLLEAQGDVAGAIESLEKAIALPTARMHLVDLYARHRPAEDWFERMQAHGSAALELLRESGDEHAAAGLLLTLAEAYGEQPDDASRTRALDWYAEILALEPEDPALRVRCNDARAALLRALGRRDEALDAYRAALADLRRIPNDSPGKRGAIGIRRRLTMSAFLDLLFEREPAAAETIEAFELIDEAKSAALQNDNTFSAIALGDGPVPLPPDVRSNLLTFLQQRYAWQETQPELLESWNEIFRDLGAEELPDFFTALVLEAVRGELPEVDTRAPTWLDIRALVETLGDRAAAATYVVTDRSIHCLVVRPGMDAPSYAQIPVSEEQLRERYWASYVRDVLDSETARSSARHAWRELGTPLFGSIERELDGVDVLYVVPDERLFWIPFHALTVQGRPHCFARAVVTVPSLGYLERRVRLLAAPEPRLDTVGAVGYTNADEERELFEGEAAAVARYFGGEAIAGADATQANFTALASRVHGLLHVSLHGKYTDDADEGAVLLLADGELSVFDWMSGVQSSVRLCTFSACEAGRARLSEMKPYFGFPRVALMAGARAVLAPLWSVDAQAARDFCLRFYEMTWSPDGVQKLPLAEGYRRALVAQAELPGSDVRKWASFALTGDGR